MKFCIVAIYLQSKFSFIAHPTLSLVLSQNDALHWSVCFMFLKLKEGRGIKCLLFLEYNGNLISRWNSCVCRAHSLCFLGLGCLCLALLDSLLHSKISDCHFHFPPYKRPLQQNSKKKEIQKWKYYLNSVFLVGQTGKHFYSYKSFLFTVNQNPRFYFLVRLWIDRDFLGLKYISMLPCKAYRIKGQVWGKYTLSLLGKADHRFKFATSTMLGKGVRDNIQPIIFCGWIFEFGKQDNFINTWTGVFGSVGKGG